LLASMLSWALSMIRSGGGVVGWLGVVRCRGRVVRSRGGFVWGWCGFVWGRGGVVWLSLWIHRGSFVGNFSDVSVVMVSSVLDMLSSAIGKSNGVGSTYSVAIRGLASVESSLGVVISNCVLIGVWLWSVFWLLVWSRGGVVGGLVNHRGRVVGGLVNHRGGVVGRLVNHRSWVVGGLRVVGFRCRLICWHWGMVDWSRFVYWGRVVRGGSWVVWGRTRVVGGLWVIGCWGRVIRGG